MTGAGHEIGETDFVNLAEVDFVLPHALTLFRFGVLHCGRIQSPPPRDIDQVEFKSGTSDLPDAGIAGGSAHTATAGMAIHDAGAAVLHRIGDVDAQIRTVA